MMHVPGHKLALLALAALAVERKVYANRYGPGEVRTRVRGRARVSTDEEAKRKKVARRRRAKGYA